MELYAPVVDAGLVTADPIVDLGIASKQYVDTKTVNAVDSIVIGNVFITNIAPTSTGIVGSKTFAAGTVPANLILQSAATDTTNITVSIVAEGGNSASFSPTVTLNGGVTATLTQAVAGTRSFTGTANITLQPNLENPELPHLIVAESSTGATAQALVTLAGPGPVVQTLAIGSLPGTQTAVKGGDVVTTVTGTVENAAVSAEIIALGASASISALTLGANDSGGVGYKTFTGSFTVHATNSGAQSIQVRARNNLGTYSAVNKISNSITLDQVKPTFSAVTVSYPATQTALKNGETATVNCTVSNYSSVSYTSSADLSVSAPSTYGVAKTVSCLGGTYSTTNNYTITATKAANNSTASVSAAILIANVAPTAAISYAGSPARMISSDAGSNYVVTVTANQSLASAPTLVASSGTWQGAWAGSGTTWTRTLQIKDTDVKGNQTFNNLVVTGKANLVGNTITSGAAYTIGGFSQRYLTVPALSQLVAIGTQVRDVTKVVARYKDTSNDLTYQASTAQLFQGFTIVNSEGMFDAQGSYFFITDAAFAGANTSGTLQIDIRETA